MKNKKMLLISMLIFSFGVIMLFGSSYSLINGIVSNESYSFNVANFDAQFQDNAKISLTGVPTKDEDGLRNSKEFTFTINNDGKYDVNYRLDIIENSVQEMKNIIKYAYSLNNGGYSEVYLLEDNFTLNQNKVLKAQEKDTYKLRVWLSIDADEIYMNKTFSASIMLQATSNENKYATNVIEYLGKKESDGVTYVDNNYRYKGDKALNYIWFNCEDNYTRGDLYCEKWRIIGSFTNTWENGVNEYASLKIIRPGIEEKISFDNDNLSKNYENSYINNYANGSYYDLLNNDAKNFILKSRWYIGDVSKEEFNEVLQEEKSNYTFANVGLLNVSDYIYLGNSDWLVIKDKMMTINKTSDNKVNAIVDGKVTHEEVSTSLAFAPVINLRPDVSFVSGDGSYDNPYEIGILYPLSYGVKK